MLTIYRMPDGVELAEVTSLDAALAVSRMQGDVWLYAMTPQSAPLLSEGYRLGLPRYILHDGGGIDITSATDVMRTPTIPRAR